MSEDSTDTVSCKNEIEQQELAHADNSEKLFPTNTVLADSYLAEEKLIMGSSDSEEKQQQRQQEEGNWKSAGTGGDSDSHNSSPCPSIELSIPNRSKSLSEEGVPIHITWKDVTYEVKEQNNVSMFQKVKNRFSKSANIVNAIKSKKVLSDVSGCCRPGELLAVMGASGSGKTSLLNILSGRNKNFTGKVLINGVPADAHILKHTSFIQQTDQFFKELTVTEHLQFQARLRLPNTISKTEKAELVTSVIHELGLTKISNSRIGQVGMGGISGGERRRLTIASEILTNPSLLFLDEPTSGLDSFMAEEIIHKLKELTHKGRTVICTIHQPSSEVYALFDSIIYLAEGRVAYEGTLYSALSYFSSLGYKCPSYSNPADFFIKQLSIIPARLDESKAQVNELLEIYAKSDLQSDNIRTVNEVASNSRNDPKLHIKRKANVKTYNTTWLEQFVALLWRANVNLRRDPMLFRARLFQAIFLSLLGGLIFLRLGNGQTSVQNKIGALYFMLLSQSMSNVMQTIHLFPSEISVFTREYSAGMYRSDAYFLAKNVAELPFQMIFPAIFATIAYWMIGFSDDASKWIEVTLLIILTAQSALSLGYVISTGSPSVQVSLVLGPLILLPFMLFGGLFINSNSIPNYFYWLSYASFFKYGFEACNIVIWKDMTLECSVGQTCLYHTGDDVLSVYGWSSNDMGQCIGALFALMIGFRIFAYFFLYRRAQKAR